MADMTMAFRPEQGNLGEKFAIQHVELIRVRVDFPDEPGAELIRRASEAPEFYFILDVEDEAEEQWRVPFRDLDWHGDNPKNALRTKKKLSELPQWRSRTN